MLDLPEPPSSLPFDARLVDDLSEAELDGLSFGVICLDAEGTILRYNLYESRLARLDRNQVLGRNFFTEVAPCTRTAAFEGRFRAFLDVGGAASTRFDFVFDFKFGAQTVRVEIVRAPAAERFYLLVNRVKVAPPRPAVPKEKLAALQTDLAPDEGRRGVRRDALERRFVDVPAHVFSALRATCDRLAPDSWFIFANEWGVEWGRRAAIDLEASTLEAGERSLRELPMRRASELVASYFGERGWGGLRFDFTPAAEGLLVAELERSALAEAAPRPLRADAAQSYLACHLLAGSLAAIFSSLAGRRLAAREVACAAAGASTCAIAIVAHDRRGAVDAALSEGARGVDAIRAALRRAPRGAAEGR